MLLQGDAIVSYIRKTFKSVAATDEEFEAKLRGSLYDENPEAVRFIFCSIEAEHQTKEIYTNLWSRDNSNNKYVWTIEHIFPEGQNIPDCWVDMIANGDIHHPQTHLGKYVMHMNKSRWSFPIILIMMNWMKMMNALLSDNKMIDSSKADVEKYCLSQNKYEIGADTIDNIFKYVMPEKIFVKRDGRVAILCKYKFDEEHGIAIVYKDNVIDGVGYQDIIL